MYGVHLDRRMLDNILYVVDNSNQYSLVITTVSLIALLVIRYNNKFPPLLWQFFLIQIELESLWVSERNVFPPAWISSAGI
jgi:hypothetical protein